LVLKNKLGILDADELDRIERKLVAQRNSEGAPAGRFDLDHLKAIHRHLFQDVYAWAGKIRIVETAKDGSQFQFRQYIGNGMADVYRRLEQANFLRNLNSTEFAEQAGPIMGDVNYVHPFREGNGRTQLAYLKQLAHQAGHSIALSRITPKRWIAASRSAHGGEYKPMSEEIFRALERAK
jgi:cell filamentation protein